MTPKQVKFAQGVAAGKTQKQAYIDAGYKGKGHSAEVKASELVRTVEVAALIAQLQAEAAEIASVSAADVIRYLARVMAEGIEEARKPNGTRFRRTVGTAHRIRAAELLGRAFKLWTEGNTQPEGPQGIDYSKLTDAELEMLEKLAEKASGAHVGAGPLIITHPPEVLENGQA